MSTTVRLGNLAIEQTTTREMVVYVRDRDARDCPIAKIPQTSRRTRHAMRLLMDAMLQEGASLAGDALGGNSVDRIIAAVTFEFDVSLHDLFGPSRLQQIVKPRTVAIALVRECLGWSTSRIGRLFNRDHTTVIDTLARYRDYLAADPDMRLKVQRIQSRLLPREVPA
jgi:chromosomal replication initiation ATPase DnaA